MAPLLEVKNLKTHFFTADGVVKAVDGISYDVAEGEVVGIVGESGCGKSVGAMSIMRLVASPPGRCLLYTSPSQRDIYTSRIPSSA